MIPRAKFKEPDVTANFYRFRVREPEKAKKCRVPEWAAKVAGSVKKGAKITSCEFKDGWATQSVLIPKYGETKTTAKLKARKIINKLEKKEMAQGGSTRSWGGYSGDWVGIISERTGIRKSAVKEFVEKHNIESGRLGYDIVSGKVEALDFVTALTGKPNNTYAKNIIKEYGENMAKGGGVSRIYVDDIKGGGYSGKRGKQAWNGWSGGQRLHFLSDHIKGSTPATLEELSKKAYNFLPKNVKDELEKHISVGQYKKGGSISWKPTPTSKGLVKITETYSSRDDLRPRLMGVYFDKGKGIVASDAFRLVFIKAKPTISGNYCIGKHCTAKRVLAGASKENIKFLKGKEKFDDKREQDYPDYKVAITSVTHIHNIGDGKEIKDYIKYLKSAKRKDGTSLLSGATKEIVLKYSNEYTLVNGYFIIEAIKTMKELGHDEVELGLSTPNRAIIIAPLGYSDKAEQLASDFVIVMPIMQGSSDWNESIGDKYFNLKTMKPMLYEKGINKDVITSISKPSKKKDMVSVSGYEVDPYKRSYPKMEQGGQISLLSKSSSMAKGGSIGIDYQLTSNPLQSALNKMLDDFENMFKF